MWAAALLAGAIASVLEAVCPGEVDNLAIPIVVAVAMVAIGM
jgi:dolichol kinase